MAVRGGTDARGIDRDREMRCDRLKISPTDGRLSVDYRTLEGSSNNIADLPIGPIFDRETDRAPPAAVTSLERRAGRPKPPWEAFMDHFRAVDTFIALRGRASVTPQPAKRDPIEALWGIASAKLAAINSRQNAGTKDASS